LPNAEWRLTNDEKKAGRRSVVFILLRQGFGVTGRRRVLVDAFIGREKCELRASKVELGKGTELWEIPTDDRLLMGEAGEMPNGEWERNRRPETGDRKGRQGKAISFVRPRKRPMPHAAGIRG